jgi:hypothetical protein
MSEASTVIPLENKRPLGKLREWITSVILITFTTAVGFASVIALASTLTQTRLSTIAIEGVPINIWKLDDIRQDWLDIQLTIQQLSTAIIEAERRRGEIQSKLTQARGEYHSASATFLQISQDLQKRLEAISPDFAKKFQLVNERVDTVGGPAVRNGDPTFQFSKFYGLRETILKDRPEFKDLFDNLGNTYNDYGKALALKTAAESRFDSISAEILDLQVAADGRRTSLMTLFGRVNPKNYRVASSGNEAGQTKIVELDDATRSRIENALYELNSGRGLFGGFINMLVTTQSDILTLTLVILMGILGSSLQMTYAFFKQHRVEKVGAYMLRVCVGAITALVIFIVAKAGVPVVADATRLGGDAAINPYFVSFLAIISGLMSDNAILSVQSQGARFFGPDKPEEPGRWSRQDLRPIFESSNRDPQRVRRLIGAKDDEFQNWISGREQMPANVQMIIAGVLQTPPRDLFTDIPPDQVGSTA